MNTRNEMNTRIRIDEEQMNQAPARAPKKRGPDEGLLRLLRGCMLFCGAVILVLGLLLILFPMFKVQGIVVEGNSYCATQDIVTASGIVEGNELIGLDLESAMYAIFAKCPNVETCTISVSFPFTIKIRVTEKAGVMYAAYGDQYISFSRDFRVLEIDSNGEEKFSPFLRVKLPTVSSAIRGSSIQFADGTTELAYATSLLDSILNRTTLGEVTFVDLSERFSLSFILSNTVRVEIGKLADMELKLTCAEEILRQKGGVAAGYAVIDVSNPSKPTYQKIGAEQLFD